jgi:Tfp pilus assembly protein PilE
MMLNTKPIRSKVVVGVLDQIRADSFHKETELQAAKATLQAASELLEVFREANPEWPMAFSWTPTGREKARLEANLWEAIRWRDRCRGAYDLSTHYRLLIEQAVGAW